MVWFMALVLAFTLSPWSRAHPPVPLPLAAEPLEVPLPEAYGAVRSGPQIMLLTTRGPVRLVLFSEAAPRFALHLLREVQLGTFTGAWVGRVARGSYVELGDEDLDYDTGGGSHRYELMATAFDHNALPQLAGSVIMERGFSPERAVRTRYAIVTADGGYHPGTVVGHVVEGLSAVRDLGTQDRVRLARRWEGL